MVVGDEAESSIIIIACRRLAPAAMGMEISEKGAEGGNMVRPSAVKSGAAGVVYGAASSPFDDGRGLKERTMGRRVDGTSGEGDDGSQGRCVLACECGEFGVGNDTGCAHC